tara:strand:+ start:17380 stop:18000 length:621 start_codon:yes stop_codon:yes gene_type:complete
MSKKKPQNKTTLSDILLIGRVGNKKITEKNNKKVAYLSLGVNKKIDTDEKKTFWHDVVFYENLSNVIDSYVNVGDKIIVNGQIQTWNSDENNESKMMIRAKSMNFDTGSLTHSVGFVESKYQKDEDSPLIVVLYTLRTVLVNNDENEEPEKKLKKDFQTVYFYGKLANIISEVPKNTKLLIVGELETQKEKEKYKTYIRAREAKII